MDTDDLSEMAYETLSLAGDVFDALRTEIGASASEFRTEDAFLKGVLAHMAEILDDPDAYLDFWDSAESIDQDEFVAGVKRVRADVNRTLKTRLPRGVRPGSSRPAGCPGFGRVLYTPSAFGRAGNAREKRRNNPLGWRWLRAASRPLKSPFLAQIAR